MKKLILLLLLLSSFIMMSQDKITVKTINKERQITGYLIVYVNKNHQAIKTIRVDDFNELKEMNILKNADGKIHMKDIPLDLLNDGEYLKNGAKTNNK